MKNTEIKNIFFRNNGASALYCGSALIWKKDSEEIDPDNYIPKFNFSGKFTDDSTESDWWYILNYNGNKRNNILDVSDKKIFDTNINLVENNKSNYGLYRWLFDNNSRIEKIYKLENFELINSFDSMFNDCSNLISVNFKDLKSNNVVSSNLMFGWCNKLEKIYNIDWNFENNENSQNMFILCNSLNTIQGVIKNIKLNLDLRYSPLTNDSAMVLINGLSEDIEDTRTSTFNRTTYDTLTEEQIALATAKGWSVVRS